MGKGGSIGEKANIGFNPCGNQRSIVDPVGRLNDLINCYIATFFTAFRESAGLILVAFILLAIMLIAANKVIRD